MIDGQDNRVHQRSSMWTAHHRANDIMSQLKRNECHWHGLREETVDMFRMSTSQQKACLITLPKQVTNWKKRSILICLLPMMDDCNKVTQLTVKSIVQINIFWKYSHPQAIQDVDEFVSSSDLEKFSIPSLAQQWILCSEWVPSEWESKQLIKTSQ